MSVAMIPMLWWWGMDLPVLPQLAVFGFGAVWFLSLAASGSRVPSCSHHEQRGLRLYNLHHFVLMAAMVWMVTLMSMPSLASAPASAALSTRTPAQAAPPADPAMDHSMDHAMVMPGPGSSSMLGPVGSPPAATALSLVLAAYFLLLIPWWLRQMIGAGRAGAAAGTDPRAVGRAAAVEAAVHAAKCGCMGVMLLAML
jgi:hypothetical protein